MTPPRLAVVVSHSIPYFARFHAAVARRANLDLRVFFCTSRGRDAYHDPDFAATVRWDVPLVEGYASEVLPSRREPGRLSFLSVDNPRVGERLAAFGPDAVLVHGYAYRTIWRAVAWARRSGVPTMILSDSSVLRHSAPWRRAAKAALVRWFYGRIDAAFVTGVNNAAYHRRYGLPAERLLPGLLPAEVERIRDSLVPDPATAGAATRARLGIPPGAFVPLYCGKFTEGKRAVDLLDAAAALRARGVAVAPLLVGDGPLGAELRGRATALALDPCVFTGFVNQSAVPAHYAAADVLVLPSRHENQGLVIPEAAAAGRPAVVSDAVGGVGPEGFARPGENALVYPCGDVGALADALETLARDPALRARMGATAARLADGFGAEEAARRLEAAVSRLLALGPRSGTAARVRVAR